MTDGPRSIARLLALLALAVALTGCYEEPVAIATYPPGSGPEVTLPDNSPADTPRPTSSAAPTGTPRPTPTRSPSPPPTPGPTPTPAAGAPGPGCVDGWTNPSPGSDEHEEGVAILTGAMGVAGPWDVAEMRYFIGPEVPWIIDPGYDSVARWYVRAALSDEPDFRGRWLLEKRTELILGVSAVAPFESTGYESPDWTGFVGEGPPTTYLGLPGEWSGIPYDFVTGEGDSGNPGLPDEVVECLADT
jgi:hypothetical protein